MYDIITFGSAARDIFVKSKAFKILKNDICLPSGSKIEVEDISFSSGGGGTNTAATFAKQGFKTAFCGAVGDDLAGQEIIKELKQLKIDTRFVLKKREKRTNHSVIISSAGDLPAQAGDRTILVYRGASELLSSNDILWKKIKAKWFYLAPLTSPTLSVRRPTSSSRRPKLAGGGGRDIFGQLVDFAHNNKIKVAVNPSKQQLSLPEEQLKNIFKKVDVLFLNQEEASFLTKIPFSEEQNIFRKIDEICPGVAVMTKGGEGVVVSDGKYLYSAKPNPKKEIVDTTGAGDSFASGFLSDFIRYNGDTSASGVRLSSAEVLSASIEKAIQLGLANSLACLSEVGAKNGLLEKNSKFERVKVSKEECGENNLCITK